MEPWLIYGLLCLACVVALLSWMNSCFEKSLRVCDHQSRITWEAKYTQAAKERSALEVEFGKLERQHEALQKREAQLEKQLERLQDREKTISRLLGQ